MLLTFDFLYIVILLIFVGHFVEYISLAEHSKVPTILLLLGPAFLISHLCGQVFHRFYFPHFFSLAFHFYLIVQFSPSLTCRLNRGTCAVPLLGRMSEDR